MRRSLLFIPGNNPGMIQNAGVFDADGIIIDLEDAVSLEEKDAARLLVIEALKSFSYERGEVILRINPYGTVNFEKDLKILLELPIHTILLPKATVESITTLGDYLNQKGLPFKIIALIESPQGVEESYEILKHDRCDGVMLGGEDLTVSIGIERTKSGQEILYPRLRLVNAAKAVEKTVIDTPFTDTTDDEGLFNDANFARSVGFDGKAAIHPKQVETINRQFSPTRSAIEKALKIMQAQKQAALQNLGVFSVDGKMVDRPIILRAEQTIHFAQELGLIDHE